MNIPEGYVLKPRTKTRYIRRYGTCRVCHHVGSDCVGHSLAELAIPNDGGIGYAIVNEVHQLLHVIFTTDAEAREMATAIVGDGFTIVKLVPSEGAA